MLDCAVCCVWQVCGRPGIVSSSVWHTGQVQQLVPRGKSLEDLTSPPSLSPTLELLAWHEGRNNFGFVSLTHPVLSNPNGQVLVSGGRSTWCTKNLPPTPHCCLQMAHFCERSATFSSKLYSSKCIRVHNMFYLGKSMKQRDSNWFLMERQLTTKDQLRQISSQRFNKV